MNFSNYRVERIGFGLLLGIALLMAFAPIVILHDLDGEEVNNAFNLPGGLTRIQSSLRVLATPNSSQQSGSSLIPLTVSHAKVEPSAMPFSLRIASLVPRFVFAALVFGLLALVDLLSFRKAFVILSLAGGCLGAIALLHVMLMHSDLQSWTEMITKMLTSRPSIGSPEDPALGVRILMTSSFLISPGAGLYVLTASLFLVPFLSSTRAVPRLRSVLRHDGVRVHTSQPICIRPVNSRYPEETCTSLDISPGGLRFESSSNHYYVGMEVYLTRNDPASDPAKHEEHGSVVRVEKMENGKCHIAIRVISEA